MTDTRKHVADSDRFRADQWEDGVYVMDTHNAGQECAGPFAAMSDAIARQDRANRLHALAGEYPGNWTDEQDSGESLADTARGRYAAIRDMGGLPHHVAEREYRVTTHATMPDALAMLANGVLDGDGPVGVVDLDTGASHGVHVTTPIVSDIGGEGATRVPWDDGDGIPAIEPGDGATSHVGRAWL